MSEELFAVVEAIRKAQAVVWDFVEKLLDRVLALRKREFAQMSAVEFQ
jgi:hypothetical protein